MPACATRSAPARRRSGVRRLAAVVACGTALVASAQDYRIPDLRPPPPRVASAPPAGAPCNGCARILSIREVNTVRGLPAAPAVAGTGGSLSADPTQQNLVGAVIYLPLGGQGAEKPYVGPVGTPEMYAKLRETSYEVTLRMDDGTLRQVRRSDGAAFGVGNRVQWLGGDELVLLVN